MRLKSLDAFRGLTILGMLLVNNTAMGDDTPAQLIHAGWNGGVHFADLVFPWFLFIVGLSMPLSLAAAKRHEFSQLDFLGKAFKRTVTLFAIGCLLTSSIMHQPVFGLGVLQLIALAYLVTSFTIFLQPRPRLWLALGFLLIHSACLLTSEVPGFGAGSLVEGHTIVDLWNTLYFEPLHLRGLFSVLPTASLAIIGSVLGELFVHPGLAPWKKVTVLLSSGLGLALLGWSWSHYLPYSKALWTASYICLSAGLGTLTLALFFAIADCGCRRELLWPLIVPGKNAIFAYVVPILVKIHIWQEWTVGRGDAQRSLESATLGWLRGAYGTNLGGWAYTLGWIGAWWLLLVWMYRGKRFWKV